MGLTAIRNVIPDEISWGVQDYKISVTGAQHLGCQGQMEHSLVKNIWANCSLLDNSVNS